MDKCRVVKKPDGSLTIIRPSPNSRREGEGEVEWLDRIFTAHMEARGMDGFPFVDMDVSQLPATRINRNKWRLDANRIVFVAQSIPDPPHPKQALIDRAKAAQNISELRSIISDLIQGKQ